MGKQNRARRAAKQRKKQQDARHAGPGPTASARPEQPDLVQVLFAAADAIAGGDTEAAGASALTLLTGRAHDPATILSTMTAVLADGLLHNWRRGWQPVDLYEVARRQLGKAHVGVLRHALSEAMRRYARPTVDPRWLDQLTEIGADLAWPAGSNALKAWERADREAALLGRRGKGPADSLSTITVALELMGLLVGLRPIAPLMALPGAYRPGAETSAPVDQKMLARVRALLAKAESTEFEEEAEALSAKAQELMTRYSLERLVVEAHEDHVEPATARRIWLDAPYTDAKSLLVKAVGDANRCECVGELLLGFVTVLGDDRDLVATELLVTSLLVQATRAMLHPTHQQETRQRSFRQSFLIAYAGRISERLTTASAHVAEDLESSVGAELVPVLAAHDERVRRARDQMYPEVVTRPVRVSNPYGYAAGRAAADLAVLDARTPLKA